METATAIRTSAEQLNTMQKALGEACKLLYDGCNDNGRHELARLAAHRLYGCTAIINHTWYMLGGERASGTERLEEHELHTLKAAAALVVHAGDGVQRTHERTKGGQLDVSACFLYLSRARTASAMCVELRTAWDKRQG